MTRLSFEEFEVGVAEKELVDEDEVLLGRPEGRPEVLLGGRVRDS